MTKEEVLQGALALNGEDKKYAVTTEDDRIIIETKYYGTPPREACFRYIAQLRDDSTYTETHFDRDGYRMRYGSFSKAKKSVSFTFGGKNAPVEVEKDEFNSENIKSILVDYLESCGYKRKKKQPLKIALCIAIPMVIIGIIIAVIVTIASTPKFVDTNGPDNYALTEITREDILKSNSSYSASMVSERHSGSHSNIIGTKLRDFDYDSISRSFGKIHGVVILHATKTSADTLTLNIGSSVKSGNAEIVILIDGEYHSSVDVNQTQTVTLQNVSNKEVIVKLAGESAKVKIDITRSY